MWSVVRASTYLILLSMTGRVASFLNVEVELIPSPLPSTFCSPTFIDDFESNLTSFVLDATQRIFFLSDFDIPGGLFLAYFDNSTSLDARALTKKTVILTCTSTCTSQGCSVSVGIGLCDLCQDSRRLVVGSNESATSTNGEDDQRMLATGWSELGLDVTGVVEPLVQSYVAQNVEAHGCLGDPNQLAVNVTYLSDVSFSIVMEQELVKAFDVPPLPVPAPTPKACCTVSFASCDSNCGTTLEECEDCSDVGATWLPQGPPKNGNVCISRGNSCLWHSSGCCAGLSCVGDLYQQLCIYAASASTLAPSPSPVGAPRLLTSIPSSAPTPPPTRQPTLLPTSLPTPVPTVRPTLLPTHPPTHFPTMQPTLLPTSRPTSKPTMPPTGQPTTLPTWQPTLRPTQLPTTLPTQLPTSLPTETPLQAQRISVGSDTSVAAVDGSGNLYVSNGVTWVTLRGGVKDVAVVNSSSIYIVGLDNNVYRLNGNNWDQIGYYSSFIATAAGAVAVVSSVEGFVWVKVNYDDVQNWSIAPGVLGATGIAVVSQSSIYYITADSSVYRTNLISLPVLVGWGAAEISASSDGTVVVVTTIGEIWQKQSDDNTNAWFQVPGKAENVAVLNTGSRYIIDTFGYVQQSVSSVAPAPLVNVRDFAATAKPVFNQSPTRLPTPPPTSLPTPPPTSLPTSPPTRLPTLPPTKLPTPLPTNLPTLPPTNLPTLPPTHMPTPPPTRLPTLPPTPSPTTPPTPLPTQVCTPKGTSCGVLEPPCCYGSSCKAYFLFLTSCQ